MSYRVLARTYRSRTFEEVVGQEVIATTLTNAITSGRVHHGYLFTGTRGVGKTSMARILAKSLNCLAHENPTVTPCCECDSCVAIALGEDMDVVEIDAASNTGVDNIRELRSNATLRPARSRFKIYIIDEVHMLSTGAFNALLKTLEEPPSHVKFILATTESQKVPATIQSRCQRFDFRAIDTDSIAKHLTFITENEKIKTEPEVLRRIARLGNGSMRDALSLLEKVLSYESDHLTSAIVDEIIPPPHDELAAAVIESVSSQDAAGALRALDQALQSGRTVDRFCDHLIEHVRTLMMFKVCGKDTELVDVAGAMRETLFLQAENFDAPTYVYMITLLEELRRNVKTSGAARALADAAVVRLAMTQQFSDIGALISRLEETRDDQFIESTGKKPASPVKKNETSEVATTIESTSTPKKSVSVQTPTVKRSADPSSLDELLIESNLNQDEIKSNEVVSSFQTEAPSISSEQWQRVARDPLVQQVKEAVDGTLMGIKPKQKKVSSDRNVISPNSVADEELD